MKVSRWITLVGVLAVAGAFTTLWAEEKSMDDQVKDAIQLFKSDSKTVTKLFDTAYGYAILPSAGKGGAGIGGGYGDGQVFEKGRLVGTCKMSQFTIGLEFGGQTFSELIFFETKDAMDGFKSNEWAMSATANAVAAAESASADAKYKNGVLVYTIAKGGLMFEASVGGQKFRFTPTDKK